MLPSQEALIQRLHHIASYSEQLLVLSGGRGSGKTTLVTALATDFDDANAALMICPMHAENAEIRRKILVQLMSSPIFDDEIPLAETLLRVASTQKKPLHIIIDDAHLLPKTLWAECIILNQIQCAGKAIAVTLTVPPEFLADLLPQLPEALRRQLLPVSVDPLPLAEREALYQTLLRYSEQNPFTPREIVRAQLEKQTGTPQEVVNLLALALHSEPTTLPAWHKYKMASIVGVSLLLTFTAGLFLWGLWADNTDEMDAVAVTYPALGSAEFIGYGKRTLMPYFEQRQQDLLLAQTSQTKFEEDTAGSTDATVDTAILTDPLAQFHGEEANGEDVNVEATDNPEQANVQAEDVAPADVEGLPPPTTALDAAENTSLAAKVSAFNATKPTQGYTVQLASVSTIQSLAATLADLRGVDDIRIARYKRRWVVLAGEFPNATTANAAAKKLMQDYHLGQPWVRQWTELGQYQLQENMPSREISK